MAHWDIAAVRAAQNEVRALSGVAEKIAHEAQPEIDRLAAGAIASRMSSYVEAWAPLKNGGQASPDIVHRMRVVDTGAQIKVRLDRVASYHDRGTRYMPARPIIPRETRGIPGPWRSEITKTAERVFAETVKDH